MTEVFVGLGSNLGDRAGTLRRATEALDAIEGVRVCRTSRMVLTDPVGGPPQPQYVNAVAQLESALSPTALLRILQETEHRFHRRRTVADGPRTLDLDLLLYGQHEVAEAGLSVPHPRMQERAFVLAPLAELAPRLPLRGGSSVQEQLLALEDA